MGLERELCTRAGAPEGRAATPHPSPPPNPTHPTPPYPTHAQVVDTTGAGDVFSAGFLYGMLRGLSLRRCAELGCMAGGAVVQALGAEMGPAQWVSARRLRGAAGSPARVVPPTHAPRVMHACVHAIHRLPHPLTSPHTHTLPTHTPRSGSTRMHAISQPPPRAPPPPPPPQEWLHARMHGELAGAVVRGSAQAVQQEMLDCYALIERRGRGVVYYG